MKAISARAAGELAQPVFSQRRGLWFTSTALVCVIFIPLLSSRPALAVDDSVATGGSAVANSGAGGNAGNAGSAGTGTGGASGGTAGTSGTPNGGTGGTASDHSGGAGGGGGGGFSNNVSGNINAPLQGGAGGDGGAADQFALSSQANGGGGGGGGAGAIISAASPVAVSGSVIGGNGGNGGTSNGSASNGGGGGGGAGIVMSTANGLIIDAAVTGGNGGSSLGVGGGDGGGGAGIVLQSTSGGSVAVNAAIKGGNSGGGGNGATGGSGIVANASANITVSSTGSITGGAGLVNGIGGSGIAMLAGGTVTNAGTISGGQASSNTTIPAGSIVSGGTGGGGASGQTNAGLIPAAGTGIIGANLTVVNSGTINGGSNSSTGQSANAITFTGGTNTLQLQAGYHIVGNVVDQTGNGSLQFGGPGGAAIFDVSQIGAQYQGFSTFTKLGTSTWMLSSTNNSAMNWSINAGTLIVNSTMSNATMLVGSGSILSGTGILGATTIAAGGIFAPGAGAPGTAMTLSSLALTSGAQYVVSLNPAASSSVNVSGSATLGGATVNAQFAGGSYVSKKYAILTAGSITGTFGSLTNINLPSNFTDTLSYDATHAYLNLALNFTPPPNSTTPNFGGGLSRNQQAVGNGLINSFNAVGGIPMVYATLTPAGLTQTSGELATGAQQTTFNAMTQFMGLLTDPFMARNGGSNGAAAPIGYADENDQTSAYAANKKTDAFSAFTKAPPATLVQRWNVWAAGYGGSQSTDGNAAAGSNNTTSSIYGSAVGADYLFSPNTLAGFSLAGGGTNFIVNNLGSGRSDLFQAGVYARHTNGNAYLSGALAYGWQDITTNRNITIAGLDQLRAEFNANAYSGRVEGGYRYLTPWIGGVGVTPYAAGQFTAFDLPAYAESAMSGTSSFALAYAAKTVTDTRSELGVRTDKAFAVADGVLTIRTRFAWAHDFDPNRSIAATFQALPGASFVVNGAAQAADSALTTASIEMKWLNGWLAAATFDGEFSNVTSSYAGRGVVRYAW